jgi:hypothetical protein
VRIKPRDRPWITPYIKHCKNVRRRLFCKAKFTNNQLNWERFRLADYEYLLAIRSAKKDYYVNLYESLSDPDICGKRWWKIAKSVYGDKKSSSIPDLNVNNTIIDNSHDKCESLNRFFIDQGILNEANAQLPVLPPLGPIFDLPFISSEIVVNKLKSLVSSKATGPDGFSNDLLKNIAVGLSLPLSRLFNFSLEVGVFPAAWKIANVIPLYKKGDRSLLSSYRPVSLLSCLSKVFERITAVLLLDYLKSNNLISEKQAGFMPGDSTINQLIIINDKILSAFERGHEVHAVFLDISKAFDISLINLA